FTTKAQRTRRDTGTSTPRNELACNTPVWSFPSYLCGESLSDRLELALRRVVGVLLGSAGEVEQSSHGGSDRVPSDPTDALGGASQVKECNQGGRVPLATLAADHGHRLGQKEVRPARGGCTLAAHPATARPPRG